LPLNETNNIKPNCPRISIVRIVDSLRLNWRQDQRDAAEKLIYSLAAFRHLSTVNAFCQDLELFLSGEPLANTNSKKEACQGSDGLIIGIFSSPYNTDMYLEALAFDAVATPKFLRDPPPSSAVPLELIASTAGFANKRHVALFMEEMIGVNPAELIGAKAFYFINRFAERTLTRTLPLVKTFMEGPIVEFFSSLSFDEAKELATAWVWLHEHFHRSGPLPLPSALTVKSSRTGAALEELRTDLKSVSAARRFFSIDFAKRLELMILGERLVRYGSESSMLDDYDARSSHLLLGMLRHYGFIIPSNGKVHITFPLDDFPNAANVLVNIIESFEFSAALLPLRAAKKAYVNFGMKFLNINVTGELTPWPELLKA
jgi:hypothetical protein